MAALTVRQMNRISISVSIPAILNVVVALAVAVLVLQAVKEPESMRGAFLKVSPE